MEMLMYYLEHLPQALTELQELASGELLDKEYFIDRLDRVLDLREALVETLGDVPTTVVELLNYITRRKEI